MTQLLIEYNKLLETRRSNLANEALTRYRDAEGVRLREKEANEVARHNRATESLGHGELVERTRSNRAREYNDRFGIQESVRHNKANESIALGQLAELNRSNRARENYNLQQLNELTRHQRAQEAETKRSNIAQELLRYQSNSIDLFRANISQQQADEIKRSNLMRESLERSSQMLQRERQNEIRRHNVVTERQGAVSLSYQGMVSATQAFGNVVRSVGTIVALGNL